MAATSFLIRHALVGTFTTGALAAALVANTGHLAQVGATTDVAVPVALTAQATPLAPSFCIFGKHKHGSGCHGGSIAQTAKDDSYSLVANGGGCALVSAGAAALAAPTVIGSGPAAVGAGLACGEIMGDSAAN